MQPQTPSTLAIKNFSLLRNLVDRARREGNQDLVRSAEMQLSRLIQQFPDYAESNSVDIEGLRNDIQSLKGSSDTQSGSLQEVDFNGQPIRVGRTITTPNTLYTLTSITPVPGDFILSLTDSSGASYDVPKSAMESLTNISHLDQFVLRYTKKDIPTITQSSSSPSTGSVRHIGEITGSQPQHPSSRPSHEPESSHSSSPAEPASFGDLAKNSDSSVPHTEQTPTDVSDTPPSVPVPPKPVSSSVTLRPDTTKPTSAPSISSHSESHVSHDTPSDTTPQTPPPSEPASADDVPYTPTSDDRVFEKQLFTLLSRSFEQDDSGAFPDWEHLKQFDPRQTVVFSTPTGPIELSMNAEFFVYPERFGVTITPNYQAFHTHIRALADATGIAPSLHESIVDYTTKVVTPHTL